MQIIIHIETKIFAEMTQTYDLIHKYFFFSFITRIAYTKLTNDMSLVSLAYIGVGVYFFIRGTVWLFNKTVSNYLLMINVFKNSILLEFRSP